MLPKCHKIRQKSVPTFWNAFPFFARNTKHKFVPVYSKCTRQISVYTLNTYAFSRTPKNGSKTGTFLKIGTRVLLIPTGKTDILFLFLFYILKVIEKKKDRYYMYICILNTHVTFYIKEFKIKTGTGTQLTSCIKTYIIFTYC